MAKAKKIKKDAHLWARDPDDWYVEPLWASRALFAAETFEGTIVDPACGMGRILDAAKEAGYRTASFDIKDRGVGKRHAHAFTVADFFESTGSLDNIVSNPPYKYGDAFLAHAIRRSRRKTALLLRAQWANSAKRSAWLATLPLSRVLMLTPRPSMPPGAVVVAHKGKDPSGGQQDYAWYIFEHGFTGTPSFGWARRASKQ